MKKIKETALCTVLVLTLSACGSNQSDTSTTTTQTQASSETTVAATAAETMAAVTEASVPIEGSEESRSNTASDNRILITYFTVPETDGVDTVGGASRVVVGDEVLGNNQYVAQLIQETLGGELFQIQTVQEYPGSHEPLLDFAHAEKADNARPELASKIENLDDYDVIFIGSPNWNADLPMPLYTFFEEHDFSGKTIIPFTVHGGSGFSRNIQIIADLEPGAEVVTDGLSISRDSVSNAGDDVISWAQSLGL